MKQGSSEQHLQTVSIMLKMHSNESLKKRIATIKEEIKDEILEIPVSTPVKSQSEQATQTDTPCTIYHSHYLPYFHYFDPMNQISGTFGFYKLEDIRM